MESANERNIPACCPGCDYYHPKFFTVAMRECAAFGTCSGVRDDRCGMRIPPNSAIKREIKGNEGSPEATR